MKKSILFIAFALSITLVNAQINQNLEKFFSMLTVENLDSSETKITEINGSVITLIEFLPLIEQYTICKVDLVNLPNEVRWSTKEEYDDLYPEDSAVNSDAKFITLFFATNVVERNPCYNATGTNVNGKSTLVGGMRTYLNINFKNSELAAKAKEYFDAYIADQND